MAVFLTRCFPHFVEFHFLSGFGAVYCSQRLADACKSFFENWGMKLEACTEKFDDIVNNGFMMPAIGSKWCASPVSVGVGAFAPFLML